MSAVGERVRTWVPVVAIPLVWATQGLAGWFVAGHGCRAPGGGMLAFQTGTVRAVVGILAAGALAIAAAATAAAYGEWRRVRGVPTGETAGERRRFMALTGMLMGGALGFGILLAGLPALLVGPCGGME